MSAPRLEELDVRTADGWSLRTHVRDPAGDPASALVGVAVLAHDWAARCAAFDGPSGTGLAPFLVERGWRTVSFDWRTHGDSGPSPRKGGAYRYDDLVVGDIPAICAFAREETPPAVPVIVIGHALGGHVALAAQGTRAIDVDGIVALAASPWLETLEPSRARWAAKRAILAAALALSRRVGRFPARALGRGSDDEPLGVVEDLARFAETGAWASADARADYLAAMGDVRVPVLGVVTEGDRGGGACAERLLALTGGPQAALRIECRDDGTAAPDRVGLLERRGLGPAWARIESWMRAVSTPCGRGPGRFSRD